MLIRDLGVAGFARTVLCMLKRLLHFLSETIDSHGERKLALQIRDLPKEKSILKTVEPILLSASYGSGTPPIAQRMMKKEPTSRIIHPKPATIHPGVSTSM